MFDCGHAHHSFEVIFHLECRYPSNEKLQRIVVLCSRNLAISTLLDASLLCATVGHLDSRRSIQRVVAVTFTVSFAYSLTQVQTFSVFIKEYVKTRIQYR